MKHLLTAVVLTVSFLVMLFSPSDARGFLLMFFAAASAAASLSMAPAIYQKAGWPVTRNILLTLGIQSTACFLSTVFNIAYRPASTTALAILVGNIYLLLRLSAEAVAIAETDKGMATSSLILGLSSFLFYVVSFLELFRT